VKLLKVLRQRLPEWTFEAYGKNGAVACFPPHSERIGYARYRELREHAVITSVCGPLYVVTELKAGAN